MVHRKSLTEVSEALYVNLRRIGQERIDKDVRQHKTQSVYAKLLSKVRRQSKNQYANVKNTLTGS